MSEKLKRFEVEMIKNGKGQDVGESGTALDVREYVSGQTYNLGDSLAESFIRQGVAKRMPVKEKKEVVHDHGPRRSRSEAKRLDAQQENKSASKKGK